MAVNKVSCLCLPNFINKSSNPKLLFSKPPTSSFMQRKCGVLNEGEEEEEEEEEIFFSVSRPQVFELYEEASQ